jgi:hypothetical protein
MSSRTLLAAAALAALLPLSSWADSGASALARDGVAGNGASGGSSYSWNYYNPHGYSGNGQSGTSTGTATGTATTAYADSHDTGFDYAGSHTASSTSTANLATATVSGSEVNAGYDVRDGGEYGQPTSHIWDTLTFTAAGAAADTISTVDLTFTVHDDLTLSPGTTSAANESYIYSTLYIGHEARSNFYVGDSGQLAVTNDNYPSGWPVGTWTTTGSGADQTFTFNGQISFQGPTWTTPFDEQMEIYCYDGAQCDGSATLALGLPTSVTVSSESGAFLSAAPTSAVPEPQNAMLLLAGLGALAMAVRRRAGRTRG